MRRLIKNKRGMSGVIGAIFTVIVFLAGFSFIMWEVTQYDSHQQVINERNRLDQDRKNEILEILNPYIGVPQLNFSVINRGSVTAHIVNLWITEYDGSVATNHTGPTSKNIYVNPGSTVTFTETPLGLNASRSYLIKTVTERGNEVTKRLDPVVESGTAGGINVGPFVLIFSADSFRYTSDNNPAGSGGTDVSTPSSAFEVDNDNQRIIFWIQIKNQAGQNIKISSQSFFLVEVRELSGGSPGTTEYERYFHIVNPTSSYSNLGSYSDYSQTLVSGQTATLKFGATSAGGNLFLDPPGNDYTPLQGDSGNGNGNTNLLWTFLVIFWKYEGTDYRYGQTIAYTAIQTLP